jgi:hypothetical protein
VGFFKHDVWVASLYFLYIRVLFLSLLVNFKFTVAIFLLISLDKICSQVHILKSLLKYCAQGLRTLLSKGVHQSRCFPCLKMEADTASEEGVPHQKLDDGQSKKKMII